MHVLFVCTANICRSAYMELLARHRLGPDSTVTVASAGTHGFRDKPMDRTMAATLAGEVDTTAFRSRPLTIRLVDEADLVLTADRAHRQFVLEEHPAAFRKVFTLGQFAEVVRRTREAGEELRGPELLRAAATMSGIAQLDADVADPFGRGSAVAEACASQVRELLDVVLPALS